ncbi:hypothetical protein DXG01_008780, partial [Tephrocybe rancida]
KIAQWFRYNHGNTTSKSTDVKDNVQEVLNVFRSMAASRPRKQSVSSLYYERYYEKKIKVKFDTAWPALKASSPGVPRIQMCNNFVRAELENETEAFRKELEDEVEETFHRELEEYKKGKAWQPRTAEEYDEYVL